MSFDANVNGENTPNTYYKEYVQVRILCRLCTCVQITRRGVVPIAEPFMRPQHVVPLDITLTQITTVRVFVQFHIHNLNINN